MDITVELLSETGEVPVLTLLLVAVSGLLGEVTVVVVVVVVGLELFSIEEGELVCWFVAARRRLGCTFSSEEGGVAGAFSLAGEAAVVTEGGVLVLVVELLLLLRRVGERVMIWEHLHSCPSQGNGEHLHPLVIENISKACPEAHNWHSSTTQ